MRFGPFPRGEIGKIEGLLSKAGLTYQTSVESETAFVEVADEEIEKMEIDPDLESLGFSLGLPVPDFHNQDFVCPKCEHCQEQAGACPQDGTALLEFSDFVQHKNAAQAPSKAVFYVVLGLVVVVVLAYALSASK